LVVGEEASKTTYFYKNFNLSQQLLEDNKVYEVKITQDHQWLIAGLEKGNISVYQYDNNTLLFNRFQNLTCGSNNILTVDISEDQSVIVGGSTDKIACVFIWDGFQFNLYKTLSEATDHIYSVSMSTSSDFLLVCSKDDSARLYNSSFDMIQEFMESDHELFTCDMNDFMFITGGRSKSLYIY